MTELVEDEPADGVDAAFILERQVQFLAQVIKTRAAIDQETPATEIADLRGLTEPWCGVVEQPVRDFTTGDEAFEAAVFIHDDERNVRVVQMLVQRIENGHRLRHKDRHTQMRTPVRPTGQSPRDDIERAADAVRRLAIHDHKSSAGALQHRGDFVIGPFGAHQRQIHARDHAIAHRQRLDVQHLVDHRALMLIEDALLLAHFDERFEFFTRDRHARFDALRHKPRQQHIRRAIREAGGRIEHEAQRPQ